MKDTAFYNRASQTYSATRYPTRADTFVQFFYKRRLGIVLSLIRESIGTRTGLSLLEIGCADGVVARAIHDAFPGVFTTLDAVDVSPDMIEVARERHRQTPINFLLRGVAPARRYDLVVEVGVLNYTPFESDIEFVRDAAAPGGRVILAVAGRDSLKNFLAPDRGYLHLKTYRDYESALARHFWIQRTRGVGFLVPLLWRLPSLGRAVQEGLEGMFAFVPDAFFEKVYLLRPR